MADVEMPRYRSHKTVWALKIAAIEINGNYSARIAPADESYAPFTTRPGWSLHFDGNEADLGYFVQYPDGFTSWSPGKAFRDGYTALAADTPVVRMMECPRCREWGERAALADRLDELPSQFNADRERIVHISVVESQRKRITRALRGE